MRQRRSKRRFNNDILDNLKIISKILSILIIIFLLIFIYSSIKVKNSTFNTGKNNQTDIAQNNELDETNENLNNLEDENIISENTSIEEPIEKGPQDTTINMAFTGDIMCHNTIYNDAYNSDGSYDFSYIFDDIKYNIQTADIAIGNLETTFAAPAKKYSGYPTFNTPEALGYNLKKLGFDVLSTANNHCYDSGYSGIESTINYLNDADISHTGTFTSEEEQNKVLIKNVKGLQIAFLSFTYGTNGIPVPSDKSYSVNLISDELILKQLANAKAQNPDLICVSMHWGIEYQTSPNNEQKRLADLLFKNGADIIIGNHPHVLQPMEKREITLDDGSTKDGFIVYSLGNFLADQNKNYTRCSAILNLSVTKNTEGKISIGSAKYVPIYTYKNTANSTKKFKIINLKNTIESYEAGYDTGISSTLYNTFTTERNNVQKILGEEIK